MTKSKVTFNNFYKTKSCPWYQRGACRWEGKCNYAHNAEEKRAAVDLTKTRLCHSISTKTRCTNPSCRYAHSVAELRATSDVYKTALCSYKTRGEVCPLGENCRFAHSMDELRSRQMEDLAMAEAETSDKAWPQEAFGDWKAIQGTLGSASRVPWRAVLAGLAEAEEDGSKLPKTEDETSSMPRTDATRVGERSGLNETNSCESILSSVNSISDEDKLRRKTGKDAYTRRPSRIGDKWGDLAAGTRLSVNPSTPVNNATINNLASVTNAPIISPAQDRIVSPSMGGRVVPPPVAKVVIPSAGGQILMDKTYKLPSNGPRRGSNGRPVRGEKNDRTERNDKGDRNERNDRSERIDRNDRNDRTNDVTAITGGSAQKNNKSDHFDSFVNLLNKKSERAVSAEPPISKNAIVNLLNCLTVSSVEANDSGKGNSGVRDGPTAKSGGSGQEEMMGTGKDATKGMDNTYSRAGLVKATQNRRLDLEWESDQIRRSEASSGIGFDGGHSETNSKMAENLVAEYLSEMSGLDKKLRTMVSPSEGPSTNDTQQFSLGSPDIAPWQNAINTTVGTQSRGPSLQDIAPMVHFQNDPWSQLTRDHGHQEMPCNTPKMGNDNSMGIHATDQAGANRNNSRRITHGPNMANVTNLSNSPRLGNSIGYEAEGYGASCQDNHVVTQGHQTTHQSQNTIESQSCQKAHGGDFPDMTDLISSLLSELGESQTGVNRDKSNRLGNRSDLRQSGENFNSLNNADTRVLGAQVAPTLNSQPSLSTFGSERDNQDTNLYTSTGMGNLGNHHAPVNSVNSMRQGQGQNVPNNLMQFLLDA